MDRQDSLGQQIAPGRRWMHVAAEGAQRDEESGRTGIAAVRYRGELEERESVRELGSKGRAHGNHHLIQGHDRTDEKRIRTS